MGNMTLKKRMSSGDQGNVQMVVLGGIYFKDCNHCKEILSSLGLLPVGSELGVCYFLKLFMYISG